MTFDIMTLFPAMVDGILSESIIGRARTAGLLSVRCHDIRDFSTNKHRHVDDTPYGGGSGMVMAAPPIVALYRHLTENASKSERRRVIYMSPKGSVLTQSKVRELLDYDRLVILCGHYEGVDQRVIDTVVDEEISVGDYVLTGGELPACILVDAVARLLPSVLADPSCHEEESISLGLLEYPHYTRPLVFEGLEVPSVLTSGDHAKIDAWRHEMALSLTKERRPDLYEAYLAAHPPKPPKRGAQQKAPKTQEH